LSFDLLRHSNDGKLSAPGLALPREQPCYKLKFSGQGPVKFSGMGPVKSVKNVCLLQSAVETGLGK
jgi:hypothetical protein